MPTSRTPGYGLFRGRVACDCLIAWLPVFEQELIDLGVIEFSIDIAQLTGNYSQSGGTHGQGGAADVWQHTRKAVQVARYMGAAAWARTRAQGFAPHTHLVLNGCPHNSPARYQVNALERRPGYNGLGRGGLGGRDDGPRDMPIPLREWEQGIAWAKARQARRRKPVAPSKPVTPVRPPHGPDIGKWVGPLNHGAATGALDKVKGYPAWVVRRKRVVLLTKSKNADVLGGLECGAGGAWHYISKKYRSFGLVLVENAGGRALWRSRETTLPVIDSDIFRPKAYQGDVKEVPWMIGSVRGSVMLTALAHLDPDAPAAFNVARVDEILDHLEAKARRHGLGRSQIIVMIDMADRTGAVRARFLERGYGSVFDIAAKTVNAELATMTRFKEPVVGDSVDEIFLWVGDQGPGKGPDHERPASVASKTLPMKPTDLDHLVPAVKPTKQIA